MKYNVTKSDVTEKKKILRFFGKGMEVNDAVSMLFEIHGSECCRMFQDVSDILTDSDNQIYFDVINNKRTYRYEIEPDIFFSMFNTSPIKDFDLLTIKN